MAEVENKTRFIITAPSNLSISRSGWYIIAKITEFYCDAIIMIHKGFNTSTSNGYIISYSEQHNQTAEDNENTFNILNRSGTGIFKEIATISYKEGNYIAIRVDKNDQNNEAFVYAIYGNSISSSFLYHYQFIGETPEDFTIMRRKILSS